MRVFPRTGSIPVPGTNGGITDMESSYKVLIRNIPLFSSLKDSDLELISQNGKRRLYTRGSVVFNEGDLEDGLYIILSGKAKAILLDEEGRELILSIFERGDFFGEMAVFDEQPRSATVEAVEDTTFLVLPKQTVHELLKANQDLALSILRQMSLRIREADEKIRTLAYYDVAGRLARTIMELLKKEGKILKDKNIAYIKLPPRQDLANMVGASRETVSRVLSSLQKKGILSLTKEHLVIYNVSNLV